MRHIKIPNNIILGRSEFVNDFFAFIRVYIDWRSSSEKSIKIPDKKKLPCQNLAKNKDEWMNDRIILRNGGGCSAPPTSYFSRKGVKLMAEMSLVIIFLALLIELVRLYKK